MEREETVFKEAVSIMSQQDAKTEQEANNQTETVADLEVSLEQTGHVQGGGVTGRPDGEGASLIIIYRVPGAP